MIGKTIVSVWENEGSDDLDLLLRFSDGTAALIEARGSEDISLLITDLPADSPVLKHFKH